MTYAKPKKFVKRKNLIRALFERDICEVRCSECGRLKVVNPERVPDRRFRSGAVEVFVYNTGTAVRPRYCVQVGAWRSSFESIELARLLHWEEMTDLRNALEEAMRASL